MSTAVVLLAAGAGDRYLGSEHKLLVPFRGRPLVAWALATVQTLLVDDVVDHAYVVTGATSLDPAFDWLAENGTETPSRSAPVVIHNPDWETGQASSLIVGVERARRDGHQAVIVGLADQPFVTADSWRRVARATGPIVVASYDGRRRPPVKLDASVWPLLSPIGDEGARTLMQLRPDLVSEVACMDNPIDIDTTEDLRKWS